MLIFSRVAPLLAFTASYIGIFVNKYYRLILISVPFTAIVYILDSWPFGILLCKLGECVKDISIGVSVFTLTALSADRFFAIVDPMRKLHATGISLTQVAQEAAARDGR